ncbi:MAG: hypothetical protein KDI90_12390 [Alphaproteobacteria bacterium]|nr:hypothetical protein [Alphaproteobacteria bacterium]
MKKVFYVLCAFFALGLLLIYGAGHSHGPYQQVEGHHIDYKIYEQLEEGKTRKQHALDAFGQPVSVMTDEDGMEHHKYLSIATRESYKDLYTYVLLRILMTRKTEIILIFDKDTLVHKDYNSETTSICSGPVQFLYCGW